MFGDMKYYYQFIEGAILGSVVGDKYTAQFKIWYTKLIVVNY